MMDVINCCISIAMIYMMLYIRPSLLSTNVAIILYTIRTLIAKPSLLKCIPLAPCCQCDTRAKAMVAFCVQHKLKKSDKYDPGNEKYARYLVEWEERLTHARSYEEVSELSKTGDVGDKGAMKNLMDSCG
jgi:hypothetical protein